MTTVYCPFKNCPYNDAQRNIHKEGICIKVQLELYIAKYDKNVPYCPEYDIHWRNTL